jgi:hypothetical protein
MVEWKGVRFYKTEAQSFKDEPFSAIAVDLSVNKVLRKSKTELAIDFSYNVDYKDKVAKLGLSGNLFLEGKEKELDKYVAGWRKDKKLPKELASPLANIITFTSEVNGVLVARALGIPAPVVPPNIKLGKSK